MTQDNSVEWTTSPGLTPYPDAIKEMEEHVTAIREGIAPQKIWLVEHPPLYTAGTSAKSEDLLSAQRFPVYDAGRGGQYTYHGPGQRVAYVMLDLQQRPGAKKGDVRAFVKDLEYWIISTLAHFDVKGEIREGRVGVWVPMPGGGESKIAAIGIRVRRWVTFHGISLNVNPNLSHFSGIVPCGIREFGVTSLSALGIDTPMSEVDRILKQEFYKIFCLSITDETYG